jgi:ABC-type multidrug transport system ATPase subunit
LVKRFGRVKALAELELAARSDVVTAVLGLSGDAGKTTSVRTSATLVRPDSGRPRVAGIEPDQRIIRQHDSASTSH